MPISVSGSRTVLQVILKGVLTAAGGRATNISTTFWYRRSAIVIAPVKSAFKAAFLDGPYAAMLAAFNIGWANGSLDLRYFDDALDPTESFSLAGVGAIATDRAASFNAVYMLYRSGVRGRKYIGSKHFAAVNEIDTTGDVLTGTGLTRWQALQTALAALLTDSTGNIWRPCNVTKQGSVYKKNPTSVVYNDVVSIALDLNLGTMLRRKVATVR